MKAGKAFATATEDMDALTFGANVLLRHLTFSEARKMPVQEIHLDQVLQGLDLKQKEVRFLVLNKSILFFVDVLTEMRSSTYYGNKHLKNNLIVSNFLG